MPSSSSEMSNELAALEATRARLEAALSEDENWRALKLSRAEPASDQRAQRRLRDARLELLLLANPLYRAWKHVDDAIEDLRKNEESLGRASALDSVHLLVSGNAAKEVTSLANLSRSIARLIQRGMPDADPEPALAKLESLEAPVSAAPETRAPPPAVADADPEPPAKAKPVTVQIPDPDVEIPDPEEPAVFEFKMPGEAQPASAAIAANTGNEPAAEREPLDAPLASPVQPKASADALRPASGPQEVRPVGRAPAPRRPALPPREADMDEPPIGDWLDEEEATVTFVTREPAPSRSSRSDRRSAPPARSPARVVDSAKADEAEDTAYPAGAHVEEAEVTILTPDRRKKLEETAQRDGNLRRFRKALLGD